MTKTAFKCDYRHAYKYIDNSDSDRRGNKRENRGTCICLYRHMRGVCRNVKDDECLGSIGTHMWRACVQL